VPQRRSRQQHAPGMWAFGRCQCTCASLKAAACDVKSMGSVFKKLFLMLCYARKLFFHLLHADLLSHKSSCMQI